jgi:outer membrane protein OmpA-like peptidoglycan-associated protein
MSTTASLAGTILAVLPGTFTLLPAQVPMTLVTQGTLDSIIVAGIPPVDGAEPAFRANWTGVDGHGAKFDLRATTGGQGETSLDELIIAGVEQYLDQRVHFTREGVQVDLPVPLLCSGIDKMIALAAGRFHLPVQALSPASREQLGRVSRIDWSRATFGVNGGEDQEKYLAIYYYVRAQRQELERQFRNDLLPYAGIPVVPQVEAAQVDRINSDPGRTDTVPTLCSTVFDDSNYLCALDLKVDSTLALQDVHLTDSMLADIASKAEETAPAMPEPRLRKRDRWLKAELDAINKRIDQMDQRKELWALRDRMDDMEDRISDIGMQVDELKATTNHFPSQGNPIEDLGRLTGKNLEVRFGAGSAVVDADGKKLLDEVARAMGRSPESRLLVTGYADKSGDAEKNLALSEQRAKAVRTYLLGLGISAERVLLNYFGARKSSGTDAAERRVELEWVH